MNSPFPGMDPYLERHWGDVHSELVALTRTALNRVLPAGLIARMEERVVVDRVGYDRPRASYPDARVFEDPAAPARGTPSIATPSTTTPSATPSASGAAPAAVAEPIVLTFEVEEHTETFVTILDADGGELVTAVEYLSPSNKLPGESREEYRRKRGELASARVSLVEIDLLRRGDWRDLLRPVVAPARAQTPYRVIDRRGHDPGRLELYPISLRNRLPAIPVPLRPGEADVAVDLQSLIEQVYVNGRYGRTDYARPCDPPLEGDDAAWAGELLKAAGRR